MSDIDQALLQFIDVMNLVDLLVKRVQTCAVGCQRYCEMKARLVSVVPGGSVSSSRSIGELPKLCVKIRPDS